MTSPKTENEDIPAAPNHVNHEEKIARQHIDISLKISNYKCFGSNPQGFDRIAPITLVVGRNNSGKSALLDLVEYAPAHDRPLGDQIHLKHRGNGKPTIHAVRFFDNKETRSGKDQANSDKPVTSTIERRWTIGSPMTYDIIPTNYIHNSQEPLEKLVQVPFADKKFIRIAAERNITPENQGLNIGISSDGRGLTSQLQACLLHATFVYDKFEKKLRDELNSILAPDVIDHIESKKKDTDHWEIFLEEKNKGPVSLSQSGSGLKTLMLVLAQTIVTPKIQSTKLNQCVFLFEELENNLHPALQRRLALYLIRLARDHGATFFLTTHSSATIDLFSREPMAQIVHVTHDGEHASTRTVAAYSHRSDVLDDLDIRASDLLQSNCIVWVEGPTDRMYFNHWVNLWTNGGLREGGHYQCVFYGGRLLAHLSAESPDDVQLGINVLNVNRQAILLMDSDRDSEDDCLGDTKIRLQHEVEKSKGYAWATQGREIENYIPAQALDSMYGTHVGAVPEFGRISEHIKPFELASSEQFSKRKVMFCERICKHITKEGLSVTLDLRERLDRVCDLIRQWNSIGNE